jgi:lauroyl/myristoyl acyltransferase
MAIPVEKVSDERMLNVMRTSRLSNGVTFVPLTGFGALRTMLQMFKKKQMVLITADRAVAGESKILNFFGAPARLPLGPVDLSILTGAPLIGGFGWRDGSRDIIEFVPISLTLSDQERNDRDAMQALLVRRMDRLSAIILKNGLCSSLSGSSLARYHDRPFG